MESKFISTSCPTCKLVFALDKKFYIKVKDDNSTIYCPNGDALHFKPDIPKRNLKEELAQVTAEKIYLETELKKVKDYNNSLISKLDQLEAKLEEKK